MPDVADNIRETFATLAIENSLAFQKKNAAMTGAHVTMDWMTDGIADKPIRDFKPGGRVSFFYNPMQAVVDDAMTLLKQLSPVGSTPESPKYLNSFIILSDMLRGSEEVSIEVGWPGPVIGLFVEIFNTQPYAGSLEPHTRARRGPRTSRQAPNGITELVVEILRRKWGRVMRVNLVSKQWPSVIQSSKNPNYHLPTITLSPNWRGIDKAL